MKNIYLHIGQPKTGTSALQEFFDANRVLIKDTCKTYYPEYKFDINAGMSHRYIFSNFCQDTFQDVRTILDGEKCEYVISDEFIANKILSMSDSDFEAFQEAFQEVFQKYHTQIIYYVRRVDDQIKSHFMQFIRAYGYVHNGFLSSFAESYKKTVEILRVDGQLQPLHVIRRCEQLVGRENLILRIYERDLLVNKNIVDDFFHLLNKRIPEGAIRPGDKNPSLPRHGLPYLSSALLPDGEENIPLRREITRCYETAFSFPRGSGVGDEYTEEFHEQIRGIDEYLPGYAQLYENRPLDMSFPEVDVKDPAALFSASLTYRLLDRVNRLEGSFALFANNAQSQALCGIAGQMAGEEVFFCGAGAAYERFKHCFASVKPVAMILDERFAGLAPAVDGIKVVRPHDILPADRNKAVILFCRKEHRDALVRNICAICPKIIECILY